MTKMISISSLRMVIAATAIAGSGVSAAATPGICSGAVDRVAVPGNWQKAVTDGIVSYRAPSSVEALTAAAYELKDPAMRRSDILVKLAEIERSAERGWAGQHLVLSPVVQDRDGKRLQTCWSGEDVAAKRKFVSLSSGRGDVLHHFYYEAVGVSSGEFERRAATIFGRGAALSAATAASLRIVRELTAINGGPALTTLKPLALPGLQVR